ncbi:alpha/beta hydrolase [Actinocorallia longicatena]|uniref:Alpha/beta hydrolase fold-3 domain-containing protein n=1 Tax=Actinocorallia longicatena TaxID=111803 RepID=A0ABP6QTZ5_9ACTN
MIEERASSEADVSSTTAAALTPPRPWEREASWQSGLVGTALRMTLRPIMHRVPGRPLPIRAARKAIDRAATLLPSDRRVRVERVRDPQLTSGQIMKAEWIIPEAPVDGAVLYLHGGGYVICSPATHRPITTRIALDTRLPVLVPRYRLAPEHPFPAALEDALEAYRWLLAKGVTRIIVAGDSAGGHLAASLAGEISRTGMPAPLAVVLYSPWVDLTCELSTAIDHLTKDPYLSPYTARRVARLVAGRENDPRLALLTCDWGALPPILIQVGGAEVLRPESEALAALLTGTGAEVTLQVWPGQMHVFQILNRLLPDADEAMKETSAFITGALATAAPNLTVVA